MITTGSDILFQGPTCETRRLRRSVVVDASLDEFSILPEVLADAIQLAAGPFSLKTQRLEHVLLELDDQFVRRLLRPLELVRE